MFGFKTFFCTLLYVLIIDPLWLGFVASHFYRQALGSLLRSSSDMTPLHWGSALFVYLAIVFGILLFVLPKAEGSALSALCWGGVFGALVYGIYDFTNFAILASWPISVTVVDLLWGIFLCATASVIAYYAS